MSWSRKIIHVDMDAFFAAVEQRDNPEYRGKPLIVGGDPFGRGVVSTASYEARKYGVRSAMSAAQARKLCPQGIFIRPHFEKYQTASRTVMAILRQHTSLVEPVSIDEAYLDVTKHRFGIEDPIVIASLIKQNIHAVTHLTASAGVAPNFFLAKIASDLKKPDGLAVIRESEVDNFLKDLPVRKIPGVGPVAEKELHALNIKTCGELAEKSKNYLVENFGKWGLTLFERAQGRDDRQVEPNAPAKQYSSEETFPSDILDKKFLRLKLEQFACDIYEGLKVQGQKGRTVILKVKYNDFEQITRSKTLSSFPGPEEIYKTSVDLLESKTEAGRRPIRLLGLGVSGLVEETEFLPAGQKDLFEGSDLFSLNSESGQAGLS